MSLARDLVLLASLALAGTAQAGYDQPPKDVLDVFRAPLPPSPYVSPTGDKLLLVSVEEFPPLARVAEPFLRLAGVRVEPRNRRRHDTPGGYGIPPCIRELKIVEVATGATTPVTLPADRCVESPSWAADGRRFAFRSTSADAVELWVADAATGRTRAMPKVRLAPMLGYTVQWLADQRRLLVKLVADTGPPPKASSTVTGPSIQETDGQSGESSTYEARDTLRNKHDEALFTYYATSQLAIVDTTTGKVTRIGKPGVYATVDSAPDGEHILVETIKQPYSYVVTFDRFPHDVDVWDHTGARVQHLASLPLADRVPVHGVPTGARAFSWRQNAPATLVWAEALDGGDWKVKVPARDKLMWQAAPFREPARELLRTEQRYSGFQWGERPNLAIYRELDENRHWLRAFTVDVDQPTPQPKLLWDLSSEQRYRHPGFPVLRELPNGAMVIRQEGERIYLTGIGASPDGDRPFLDRLDLSTRTSERIFRSDKTAFESFLAIAADGGQRFLTWHQTPNDPPNAHLRTLADRLPGAAAGEPTWTSTTKAVTQLPDPTPIVRGIKKRLVKYRRADGTELSFTLYTPPGYKEGTRVPSIVYAYPLDYADPSTAGQVSGSEQTFTRLRGYKFLLLAGYAIIDNAAFPIVGDPKSAYDTYLEQLIADAKAAVDKAVEIGVADPDRIGITGHSHGALMTVNLLAHTDLFRAGVATSGAYNKTLTPFGFQNERRSIWDAQAVYLKASPFFYANKLKLPLLIMHGDDDANPGTTPLQAVKLYEAVRGNGGIARLVMLPNEPHWYAAQESNEQLLYEMIRWFDKHVKNASARGRTAIR